MAAPMESHILAKTIWKVFYRQMCAKEFANQVPIRHMGFISKLRSLGGLKSELKDTEVVKLEDDKPVKFPVTQERRKRRCIEEKRPYKPPGNVINKIQLATEQIYGKETDWQQIQLNDRVKKFDLLTRLMKELDHDIPNLDLHQMSTVDDVLHYFQREVRDTSKLEDLAKLDLPRNLHMNIEPIRFDPETDKIYNGITAFPKRPTIVSSVKYSRKYKSTAKE